MKKINIIIYVVGSFFVLSLLFLAFSLTYSSIEKLSVQNLGSQAEDLKVKEKEFAELELSGKEWKNIGKIYAAFKDNHLMKFDEFPEFREKLEKMLQQNALESMRKGYKVDNLFEGIVHVTIDFNVRGSYANIKRFVYLVETDPKMVFFRHLRLNKAKNDIMGKLSMEAYFVK
jgi:Tfp pilus assembly protein PilO